MKLPFSQKLTFPPKPLWKANFGKATGSTRSSAESSEFWQRGALQTWQPWRWRSPGLMAAVAAALVLPEAQLLLPKLSEYQDWVISNRAQAGNWHPSGTLETGWGLLPADKIFILSSFKWMTLGEGLHPALPETRPSAAHWTVWWGWFCLGFWEGTFLAFGFFEGRRLLGVIIILIHIDEFGSVCKPAGSEEPSCRAAQRRLLGNCSHLHLVSSMFCRLLRCQFLLSKQELYGTKLHKLTFQPLTGTHSALD